MLEKLFGVMPEWMKSKLIIRMTYTLSSFITAKIVSFLTGDYLNHIFQVGMATLEKIGIKMVVHIVSVDKATLELVIAGGLMVASEWLIQHFHEKKVIPAVTKKEEPSDKPQQPSA